MAPGAMWRATPGPYASKNRFAHVAATIKSCVFNRSVKTPPSKAIAGRGNEYTLEDGRCIYDASNGAAVSCIGKYDKRVEKAMVKQLRSGLAHVPSLSLYAQVTDDLAEFLINSTDRKLSEAVFYGPGKHSIIAHNCD